MNHKWNGNRTILIEFRIKNDRFSFCQDSLFIWLNFVSSWSLNLFPYLKLLALFIVELIETGLFYIFKSFQHFLCIFENFSEILKYKSIFWKTWKILVIYIYANCLLLVICLVIETPLTVAKRHYKRWKVVVALMVVDDMAWIRLLPSAKVAGYYRTRVIKRTPMIGSQVWRGAELAMLTCHNKVSNPNMACDFDMA